MNDLTGSDVEIRPASTLILLRDRPAGYKGIYYEIFMLKRNLNSDFIGGAFVFPGGGVMQSDFDEKFYTRCKNFSHGDNDLKFKVNSGSLAYFIAAIRETFEEAGILVGLCEHNKRIEFKKYRDMLNAKQISFLDFMEKEDIYLDLSKIVYFSHWTTPVGPPRRYSTRFFVTRVEPNFELSHDNGETVESRWINPALALELSEAGEIEIIFPTVKNICRLLNFSQSDDLLAGLMELSDIKEIVPRIDVNGNELKILIPGDEGY